MTENSRSSSLAPREDLTIDYRDQLDGARGRRWFDTITVNSVLLHTNIVYPGTDTEAVGGLRAIPIGATWPAHEAGLHERQPNGAQSQWGDRFNPTQYPGSTHMRVTRLAEAQWTLGDNGRDRSRAIDRRQAQRR